MIFLGGSELILPEQTPQVQQREYDHGPGFMSSGTVMELQKYFPSEYKLVTHWLHLTAMGPPTQVSA